MRLDDIPTASRRPAHARPSAVVERIRALRPSRRTVLRALLLGAAAAALVPLDWYLTRREAGAAPSADGDDKSEFTTCAPENYDEEANNWPSGGRAVCYGGWRRGSRPCSGGWHREGRFDDGGDTADSTRVTTSCHGRNAWRWNGFRCSDAVTTVTYADGTEYSGLTIAACALDESTGPGDGIPYPGDGGDASPEPGAGGSGDDSGRTRDRDRGDDREPSGLGSLLG